MGSTFSGIELSKRSLAAHQQAMHTTGHNISNADNKHYARQRVTLHTNDPLYAPGLNRPQMVGQIGQGADVASIERIRDAFIDDRIVETMSQKEYWNTKDYYLYQVETVFNEPTGVTLRNQMEQFWSSWEQLANYPEDSAHRAVVKEKAIALSSRTEDVFRKLDQLRGGVNKEIEIKTNLLNNVSENIRVLNEKISKSEAMGDMPNDLYDKRDQLVSELSELVDVSIGRSDKDEFMVFIGQQILVQGQKSSKIMLKPEASKEGGFDVYWAETDDKVVLSSGRLRALLEVRDVILKEKINQVDSIAINVMDTTNEIHKDGFGQNGRTNINFFEVKNLSLNTNGEVDKNNDGVNDSTAIFRVSGKNSIDKDKPIGINGQIIIRRNSKENKEEIIPYYSNDSLQSVITRINQKKAGLVASMNHDNQLVLKGTISEDNPANNFMIRYLEDSGQLLSGLTGVLVSSGKAGAFDSSRLGDIKKFQASSENITLTPHYHPANQMKVSEDIVKNPQNIAAARGKDINGTGDYNSANGAKDGSNALLVAAALKSKPIMVEYDKTLGEFYNSMISKIGTEAREAKQELNTQKAVLAEFENMRQSTMGVSMDEEMANMVQYQHSYNASARMINTLNEMLDVIINRLGA